MRKGLKMLTFLLVQEKVPNIDLSEFNRIGSSIVESISDGERLNPGEMADRIINYYELTEWE